VCLAVDRLHAAFHRPSTRAYRAIDVAVWVLILASVVLFIVEEIVDDPATLATLKTVDDVILGLFAVELSLRVLTYRPPALDVFSRPPLGTVRTAVLGRVRFLFQFWQLLDLLTILALHPALRGLRALRLLRLMRTVRVFRYGNPFSGVVAAFESDRLLFAFGFAIFAIETIVGGISLFLVERGAPDAEVQTLGQGIWWAMVTLTTVGYGDYTPVTALGRVVGGVLMIGGMVTLALFAGIVGHSLVNAVLTIREETFRMGNYVNHVIVCGYERGSELLIDALRSELDPDESRVVLFNEAERPPEVPADFLWVQGEPTKESELAKVRLTHARAVIVVGSRAVSPQHADATTILTIFTIRAYLSRQQETEDRKQPLHIVAEILDTENVAHARAAGADEVIESQRLGFAMLSHTVRYPGVGDLTSQVVASGAASFYVGKQPPGLGEGLTFAELSDAVRAGGRRALVIGLRDPATGEQHINPPDDTPVPPDAEVVYLAEEPLLPSTSDPSG